MDVWMEMAKDLEQFLVQTEEMIAHGKVRSLDDLSAIGECLDAIDAGLYNPDAIRGIRAKARRLALAFLKQRLRGTLARWREVTPYCERSCALWDLRERTLNAAVKETIRGTNACEVISLDAHRGADAPLRKAG